MDAQLPANDPFTDAPAARANYEQLLASEPGVSAFVSAHAGAGKTKLLIDRLVRLMLAGADPAKILCLTFTKAAAAEMAIRLQKELAQFVTLSDAACTEKLKALHVTPDEVALARARALFARVLDLPGGMRISTIHAFCQSLLRRFPLEASVSPHFELVEDQDARQALDRVRESVLPMVDARDIAALAGLVSADGFAGLTAMLERDRERLRDALGWPRETLDAALRRAVGVTATTEQALIAQGVLWPDESILREALGRARLHGSAGVAAKAVGMENWLSLPAEDRAEHWLVWTEHLFAKSGENRAVSRFSNPTLTRDHPDIGQACLAEQARVSDLLQDCRALRCANASAALLTLAAPVLQGYAAEKRRDGLVDYGDLIRRTVALLSDGGAAWVKYKLDGGIDHVLLDEVQDTSSLQWHVADGLTEDFFSGEGARDGADRTVFAVGDIKQSIFSFQGAMPEEFDNRRSRYASQVRASGRIWREPVLDVSFRSTVPVLDAVDAVFAHEASSCGVCGPGSLSHIPHRTGQAGSVIVWPLSPRPAVSSPVPWTIPEANHGSSSAPEELVRHLADWIAARIDGGTMLESARRPVRAGDFLVLVRRRGQFDRALVRELKKRGVAVAGLDRMKLTDQLAVQDLVSLCEALLLPEDDLAVAEMLTSPFGGLSDDSLMALAACRDADMPLWEALRQRAAERPEWQRAADFFSALLRQVDFAPPYALLAEALGRLGGRARLFARLGPEAAEPIDELLASAQAYAAREAPSLQGFLHYLARSGAEVKREADAAGGVLRIMTVHGAKGLEAPVVILPDTTAMPPDEDRLHWTRDRDTGADLFLWVPNKALSCAAVDRLRAGSEARRMAEHNRLLYVAMTRARDHLLVCGWQPRGEVPPESWYAQVRRGLVACDATAEVHRWGTALSVSCPQTSQADAVAPASAEDEAPLPRWAGVAPDWQPARLPPEPALPRPISPSRPANALMGQVPPARSPLLRGSGSGSMSRGTAVHAMLQHLPDLASDTWDDAARNYARRVLPAEAEAVAAQVLAVLRDPSLEALFGPGSRAEQGVSGVVADQVVTGRVDRLAVLPERVLVADYKTSRIPPSRPDQVPILYLRQMAAYRAVLALLFPGREVQCILVWTEGPVAMRLPDAILSPHAAGSGAMSAALSLPEQALPA